MQLGIKQHQTCMQSEKWLGTKGAFIRQRCCQQKRKNISLYSLVRYLLPYILQPFPAGLRAPPTGPDVLTFYSIGLGSYLRAHVCHGYQVPLSCTRGLKLSLSSIMYRKSRNFRWCDIFGILQNWRLAGGKFSVKPVFQVSVLVLNVYR